MSSQKEYLLGIDLGTSGTKTVLFDTDGNAVASALVEYPMYQPGILSARFWRIPAPTLPP